MQIRRLGKDGPEVPVLGLGGWPLGGGMGQIDDQTVIDIVRAAIDRGVTLIDTAEAYLASEARIGKALKNGYRQRCFLATKVSYDYSRDGIRAAIERSLRTLGVDYVDLYQIHTWVRQYPLEEAMATMARLQEAGKARYIGVSNFDAEQMQRALQSARFQSTQPIYNLFNRHIETEDAPFCEREGIGILAYSPLAKGLLTGKYKAGHVFPSHDERHESLNFESDRFARQLAAIDRLQEVAGDKGISLSQLAIAWSLRLPAITCVLFGAKSVAQVEENISAAEVSLSESDIDHIEAILANRR